MKMLKFILIFAYLLGQAPELLAFSRSQTLSACPVGACHCKGMKAGQVCCCLKKHPDGASRVPFKKGDRPCLSPGCPEPQETGLRLAPIEDQVEPVTQILCVLNDRTSVPEMRLDLAASWNPAPPEKVPLV